MQLVNGIIYKITNLINGKVCVGQTTNTLKRRMSGYKCAVNGNVNNQYIITAMRAYGFEFFTFEQIDTFSTVEEGDEKETYWIKKLDTFVDSGKGYNLTTGGQRRFVASKRTRRAISKYHKGKVVSLEARQRMSEAHKGKCHGINNGFYGKVHTDATRQILSYKNSGANSPNFGITLSEDIKHRISSKLMGQPWTEERKQNHLLAMSKLDYKSIGEKASQKLKGRKWSEEERTAHMIAINRRRANQQEQLINN